ncbi:MAG TPA: hypothetical protein VGK84_05620 [Candidatus Tumulicola sp.]
MFLALWFALAAVTPVPAAAPQSCTQEPLRLEGTTVTAIYCVIGTPRSDGADEQAVPVSETFRTPGATFQRTATLRFVSGESTSRIMDRLDLAPLRLSGVLHLTLAFAGGAVRVEGALLTPGGITIK